MSGSITRIQVPGTAVGNLAQVPVDLTADGLTIPGDRNFQCWFRDPGVGGAGFNTSDAIEITFEL